MKEIVFIATVDGTLKVLAEANPLPELGESTKTRFSHVWPVNPAKRAAFRFIRWTTGERGALSNWTRTWQGSWEVRMASDISKPVFTNNSRSECIAWEHNQWNEQ